MGRARVNQIRHRELVNVAKTLVWRGVDYCSFGWLQTDERMNGISNLVKFVCSHCSEAGNPIQPACEISPEFNNAEFLSFIVAASRYNLTSHDIN
jgi:hypothetical protein